MADQITTQSDTSGDEREQPPLRTPAVKASSKQRATKASKASRAKAQKTKTVVVPPESSDEEPEPVVVKAAGEKKPRRAATQSAGWEAPKPTRGRDKLGVYYRSGRTGPKCYYPPGDYDKRTKAFEDAIRRATEAD
jgi:hypothetical protein